MGAISKHSLSKEGPAQVGRVCMVGLALQSQAREVLAQMESGELTWIYIYIHTLHNLYRACLSSQIRSPALLSIQIQPAQDPLLKDCALKWLLYFKTQSFKRCVFCGDIALYPIYPIITIPAPHVVWARDPGPALGEGGAHGVGGWG